MHLFAGEPHGKHFRRRVDELSKDAARPAADILRIASEETLLPQTLDAPPGATWDPVERVYREAPPREEGVQDERAEEVRDRAF